MDAKFSDAHALGHKRIVRPKIHILVSNPEPRPGYTTSLKKKRKKRKKKKKGYANYENQTNYPFNLKPQLSGLHLTKPSLNSRGDNSLMRFDMKERFFF